MKTPAILLCLMLTLPSVAWAQGADVEALIHQLDPNLRRIQAAKALGALGPRAAPAVPSLQAALLDPDVRLVRAACNALGKIGTAARPVLGRLTLLAYRRPECAKAAKAAILMIQGPPPTPAGTRSDAIDPANEGKLVRVMGMVTGEKLQDPMFGVSVVGVRLERVVERYQWVERKKVRSQVKLGGGKKKTTTYTYTREWAPGIVDSSGFRMERGHVNPPAGLAVAPLKLSAKAPRLGAFLLTPKQVAGLKLTPLSPQAVSKTLSGAWKRVGDAFFSAVDPASPQVGDYRVRFVYTPPHEVVLVGTQRGNQVGAKR
jgi:hypothetical protein